MDGKKSVLVGYARKSKAGGALRLSIDVEAFQNAVKVEAKDGKNFVNLIVNADKVSQILEGEREVTSICQLIDDSE